MFKDVKCWGHIISTAGCTISAFSAVGDTISTAIGDRKYCRGYRRYIGVSNIFWGCNQYLGGCSVLRGRGYHQFVLYYAAIPLISWKVGRTFTY